MLEGSTQNPGTNFQWAITTTLKIPNIEREASLNNTEKKISVKPNSDKNRERILNKDEVSLRL